ncbi:MAG: ComEC/Rec2 family competence protein, partial [Moraxellaceae bacterium]|nr:ComEC/Rec2 family competence protein [Moraxellaceae bacterium]
MGPFLASAAAGLLVLPLLPALPGWGWSLLPAPLLLLAFHYRRRRWWLWPLPALVTFAWAVSVAGQALEAAPPSALEQKPLQVSGTVAGLAEPDRYGGWKMRLRPDVRALEGWVPTGLWQLRVRSADMPLPGARCRLTVRLKRPHGVANPGGFDYEAWLLSEGVTATGSGRHLDCTAPPTSVDGVRLQIREHFYQHFHQHRPDQPEAGVLLALITGDRVLVPADAWERYAATGVIHLMAISGLHITLLAVVTAWLAWQGLVRIPGLALRIPVNKPALAVGLVTAAAYSLIAGFSVPTQRTLLMLLVVVLARWWQLRMPAFHVLTLALLAVLLRDPLAVH